MNRSGKFYCLFCWILQISESAIVFSVEAKLKIQNLKYFLIHFLYTEAEVHPSYLLRPEVIRSCHNKAPPPLAAIVRQEAAPKLNFRIIFGSLPSAKRAGSISLLLRVTSSSWLKCVLGDRYQPKGISSQWSLLGGKNLLLPHYWDGSS